MKKHEKIHNEERASTISSSTANSRSPSKIMQPLTPPRQPDLLSPVKDRNHISGVPVSPPQSIYSEDDSLSWIHQHSNSISPATSASDHFDYHHQRKPPTVPSQHFYDTNGTPFVPHHHHQQQQQQQNFQQQPLQQQQHSPDQLLSNMIFPTMDTPPEYNQGKLIYFLLFFKKNG